jgi:peptidoglycan/LPS O-acetylase OafA/YrhL
VNQARNPEIESLRAIAIALTLVQHLPHLFWWHGGAYEAIYTHFAFWGGVDLFFVISGFVVTRSLYNELQTRSENAFRTFSRFWIRRAFRLFPVAFVVLACVLLASAFFNQSGIFGRFADNAYQALWITVYVYNWFIFPLHAAGTNVAPLGVYWSLSIEEQFYFLLPFLLLLGKRGCVALMAIAVAVQFFLWRPAPLVNALSTLRFDGIAWGALIFFFSQTALYQRLKPAALSRSYAGWIVSLVFILLIVAIPMPALDVRIGAGLLMLACAPLVWLASYGENYTLPAAKHGWLDRLLAWLGSRSYGIYLVHVPVYMLCHELWFRVAAQQHNDIAASHTPGYALASAVSALVLVPLLAEASYRLLESPLRQYGRRLADRIWT